MSNPTVDTINDKYFRLIGIPVSVIILHIARMPFFFPERWDIFWKYLLLSLFFATSMWEVARWILIRVRKRYPGMEQTRKRLTSMLGLFVIQLATGEFLLLFVVVRVDPAIIKDFSFYQLWGLHLSISLFFLLVISSVYEAMYFFEQYRHNLHKTEALKRQQTRQQLESLKNRVNPHFLFNSLTTLSALIPEDPDKAELFVDELSKVYRYLLRAGRQPSAPLDEELQFAYSYSFLLKTRFESGAFELLDNCLFEDEKGPGRGKLPEKHLPALTLQNAIDYLLRTQNLPLRVCLDISYDRNSLHISCEDHPKNLSVDVFSHDWLQLESAGAEQFIQDGQMVLVVPFLSAPPASQESKNKP